MKRWKIIGGVAAVLVLAAIIVCMVLLLFGKKGYSHKTPRETVRSFERSFNRYDLDGMLDCTDERCSAVVRGVVTLAGKNWKLDADTIFEVISLLVPNLPKLTDVSEKAMPKLQIQILDEESSKDSSDIRALLTLRSGKSYVSNEVVFHLKKQGDDWLIRSIGA